MTAFVTCMGRLALWLFAVLPAMVHASCDPDPQVALGQAVLWHAEQNNAVLAVRGLNSLDQPGVEMLARVPAHLRLTRQKEVALIYHGDGPICALLIEEDGQITSADTGLLPETVALLRDAWLDALAVPARQSVRSAGPRSAAALNAPEPETALASRFEARAISQRLSAGLFPVEIAEKVALSDEVILLPAHAIGALPVRLLELSTGAPMPTLSHVFDIRSLIGVGYETGLAPNGFPDLPPMQFEPGWSRPLIIGDPKSDADPDWFFPPLPGAREEAEAVAQSMGAKAVLGRAATLERVRAGLRSEPDFIYFAAHGISDPDNPMDGGFIALSDGRLTAREVLATRLPGAPIVVLSACQTGLGLAHAGGMIGLSRSFVMAGASAVVVSLWDVDDAATAFVMGEFAAHVGHLRPSAALTKAMAAGQARFPDDPALWAGFIVYSNIARDGG